MDGKEIKFPDDHYVGFQNRSEDPVPLGFMTPDGNDAASVKRKATVDNWSTHKIKPIAYKNEPLVGFSIRKTVRHYSRWGSGNTKWRILDPRGFELEINSNNMLQIMENCTIRDGEIMQACKWARLKNENILVPVSSDVYTSAVTNTARVSKKASVADAQPGDKLLLHDGSTVTFLGRFYEIESGRSEDNRCLKVPKAKKYVLIKRSGDRDTIDTASTLKISEINPTDNPLSLEQAEAKANELCYDSACFVTKFKGAEPVYVDLTIGEMLGGDLYRNLYFAKVDGKESWINPRRSFNTVNSAEIPVATITEFSILGGITAPKSVRSYGSGWGYYGRNHESYDARNYPASALSEVRQVMADVMSATGAVYRVTM